MLGRIGYNVIPKQQGEFCAGTKYTPYYDAG